MILEDTKKIYFLQVVSSITGILFLFVLQFLRIVCFQQTGYGTWYFVLFVGLLFMNPLLNLFRKYKVLILSKIYYLFCFLFYLLGIAVCLFGIFKFYFLHPSEWNIYTVSNSFNIPILCLALVAFLFSFISFFLKKEKWEGRVYFAPFCFLALWEDIYVLKDTGFISNLFLKGITSLFDISTLCSLFFLFCAIRILFRNHSFISFFSLSFLGLFTLLCSFFLGNVAGFFLGFFLYFQSQFLGLKDL